MPLLLLLLQAAFNPDPVQDAQSVLADATARGGGLVRCPVQDVEQGARGYAVLPEHPNFHARVPFWIDAEHVVVGVPPGQGTLRLVEGARELGTLRYAEVRAGEEGRCLGLEAPEMGEAISRPPLFQCARHCERTDALVGLEGIPPEKRVWLAESRAYCGCQTTE